MNDKAWRVNDNFVGWPAARHKAVAEGHPGDQGDELGLAGWQGKQVVCTIMHARVA